MQITFLPLSSLVCALLLPIRQKCVHAGIVLAVVVAGCAGTDARGLGSACEANEDCTSGVCFGTCATPCWSDCDCGAGNACAATGLSYGVCSPGVNTCVGRDAGTPQGDAGSSTSGGHCTGTATACSGITSATGCGEQLGCYSDSACTGTPRSCSSAGTSCTAVEGCRSDDRCSGSATSCYSYFGSASCESQDGCNYSGLYPNGVCGGSANSCSFYSAEYSCESQDGCSWSAGCAGTAAFCSTQTDYGNCVQQGCSWGAGPCTGMVQSCAGIAAQGECRDQLGCSWVCDDGTTSCLTPAGVCGDSACGGTEDCGSCPGDCGTCPPPSGWTCNDSAYNDGTSCDCGCGVVDPDCGGAGCGAEGCSASACERCSATGSTLGSCPHLYGACTTSADCAPDTPSCVNFTTGSMCSASCGPSAPCPPTGTPGTSSYCGIPYNIYWCYVSCTGGGTCPTGTTCYEQSDGSSVCL
jgi:hypothetical protein